MKAFLQVKVGGASGICRSLLVAKGMHLLDDQKDKEPKLETLATRGGVTSVGEMVGIHAGRSRYRSLDEIQEEVSNILPSSCNEFVQLGPEKHRFLCLANLCIRRSDQTPAMSVSSREDQSLHRNLSVTQPLAFASAVSSLFLRRRPSIIPSHPQSISTEAFRLQSSRTAITQGSKTSFQLDSKMAPPLLGFHTVSWKRTVSRLFITDYR